MATWKVPEGDGCPAARMWNSACATLNAPDPEGAWRQVVAASQTDGIWHCLANCVAYQAGVWQGLLSRGAVDAVQPAAFRLALVLRHTPPDLAATLLGDLLAQHPQNRDLTSYILALLTEAELPGGDVPSPGGPAPHRDLQLFADCELAVLAAQDQEYDRHADLVRAEYGTLDSGAYVSLRVKILNQLSKIPKLFHTLEFESLEAPARANIEREIRTLKEKTAKP